ncbi:hypothetical protein PYCC9005_002425 [Savitreella phatthalungensis]
MTDGISYTAFRLTHASHEHVHETSRVRFVGPIPHGWLTTQRKRWYMPQTHYHRQQSHFQRCSPIAASDRDHDMNLRWRSEAAKNASVEFAEAGPDAGQRPSDLQGWRAADESAGDQGTAVQPTAALAQNQRSDSCRSGLTVRQPIRPALTVLDGAQDGASREPSTASTSTFMTARESFSSLQDDSDHRAGEVHSTSDSVDSVSETSDSSESISTIRPHRPRECRTVEEASPPVPSSSETTASYGGQSASDRGSTQPLIDQSAECLTSKHDQGRMNNLVRFKEDQTEELRPLEGQRSEHDPPISCSRVERSSTLLTDKQIGLNPAKFIRRSFRKTKLAGEIVRSERLLARVEITRDSVPVGYNEGKARRISRHVRMHWRELICVARSVAGGLVALQFHRQRKISVSDQHSTTSKPYMTLLLDPSTTRASLYSTLDKTIVIWQSDARLTRIFILRPQSTPASIEWYAYIQTCLGVRPPVTATISVPSLDCRLRIELQHQLDTSTTRPSSASHETESGDRSSSIEDDLSAHLELDDDGHLVAGGHRLTGEYLIDTCWRLLSSIPSYQPVLRSWTAQEKLGLCWRRYDRLEWAHGRSAQQLIGSWAMHDTHELEFRPKVHYPTNVRLTDGQIMTEPPPIEGFAVRMTGSTGRQMRFGKVYYKRVYLASYGSMLIYLSPGKAASPPPPNLGQDTQATEKLWFDVDPYPLDDEHIAWLRHDVPQSHKVQCDKVAATEAARRLNNLRACLGYIDLASVVRIRRCSSASATDTDNVHRGDNVDFHGDESAADNIGAIGQNFINEEGSTADVDEERMFELVLATGLIIRFQVYSRTTRDIWMRQLDGLAQYWRLRHQHDCAQLLNMRKSNMIALHIDEDIEARIAQLCSKWEVSNCASDAHMYNFCQISSCRTVAMRGSLWRKPRTHATFRRFECVLAHGQLLVFHHHHWSPTQGIEKHIHHERHETVDLRGCYVYSGTVTEDELLNMHDASDRDGPGRHALPRLYEDGWTTRDEQAELCFVIWSSRKRAALFRTDKEDIIKGKGVPRLGVEGKSRVYMVRSRQERDLWVQALNLEIERSYQEGVSGHGPQCNDS